MLAGIAILPIESLSGVKLSLSTKQPRQNAFDRALRLNSSGGILGRFLESDCVEKVRRNFDVWKWILLVLLLILTWSVVLCVFQLEVGAINVKLASLGAAFLLTVGLLVVWTAADTVVFRGFFMLFHPAICD